MSRQHEQTSLTTVSGRDGFVAVTRLQTMAMRRKLVGERGSPTNFRDSPRRSKVRQFRSIRSIPRAHSWAHSWAQFKGLQSKSHLPGAYGCNPTEFGTPVVAPIFASGSQVRVNSAMLDHEAPSVSAHSFRTVLSKLETPLAADEFFHMACRCFARLQLKSRLRTH